MKTRIPTRLFSLLLVVSLLISSCPLAFASSFADANVYTNVIIQIPESTKLTVGDTLQLEASVEPADMAGELLWFSSDESVASVDENGLVTALSSGEVEIQAAAGDSSDVLALTITAPLPPAETEPSEEVSTEDSVESPPQGQPDETVPETETIPEEIVPEETIPEETVPEETVPEETAPEETVPEETVPEETVPEETVPEETEPLALPYGLTGMPEEYVLSEDDLKEKVSMREHDVLASLSTMTAGEDYVADQIIFSASSEDEAAAIAAAYNAELTEYSYGIGVADLSTVTVAEAVDACLMDGLNLPVVSPNYISTIEPVESNDSSLSLFADLPEEETWYSWVKENMSNPDPLLQTPTSASYQWMHDAVDTYAAWGVTTGASWVKVAVIDTGVYASHKDLSGRVTTVNVGCGTDDTIGHGTHVAGIIAGAMNNGVAGAGIAPGVSIISLRVSQDNGEMYDTHIAKAINEAVNRGAHIINMSLGGPGYNATVQTAINNAVKAGVTVIAAMGNVGSNSIVFPAAYEGVIAVAATDKSNDRANFSNYGTWVDISAPGDNIYSTYIGGTTKSTALSGTSMAAPVVAGIAALYTSVMGSRVSPAAMEKALKASATKLSDSGMGAGLVNAANMLDDKPDVPAYFIRDTAGNYYTAKDTIPCDATLCLRESKAAAQTGIDGDTGSVLIYTTNGKTPSVKNGEVVNGIILKDPYNFPLSGWAGSSLTLKVARVSGMGLVGKVLTLNLKVAKTSAPTDITIQGSTKLISGKSCTYTATVAPVATADQTVTWSISSYTSATGDMSKAKIDAKTGKLTTPSNATGTITIKATTTHTNGKSKTLTVNVEKINPVSKITLNAATATVWVGTTYQLSVSSMVDAKGNSISPSTSGVTWTSSNTKVLTVDSSGKVTGVSAGKATVTCMTLDGSGKTAKCTITVKQQITSLSVSGQESIAPGASATYKAAIYPSNASNKTIVWSLSNAPSGVKIDSKTGKVTVDKSASLNNSFYVVATENDGYGSNLTFKYPVKICSKATKVFIKLKSYSGLAAGATKDKDGYVKSISLFSLDLDKSSGKDNQITLDGKLIIPAGGSAGSFDWSSSNTSVATISSDGVVTAHKAGTTKITCTATDGSNKKATVTLTVTNPVSSISINSSTQRMLYSTPIIACGTSAKNTAVFADTFGEPTNKKVTWKIQIYEDSINYTSYYSKYISINSSGTLSVKSSLQSIVDNLSSGLTVTVSATSTDGTNVTGSITYIITRKTSTMKMGSLSNNYNGTAYLYFYTDQYYSVFSATSSNPKVLSVYETDSVASISYVGYNSYSGLYCYKVYLVIPGFTGSTKITIKAIDGSNKSCSTNIRVS